MIALSTHYPLALSRSLGRQAPVMDGRHFQSVLHCKIRASTYVVWPCLTVIRRAVPVSGRAVPVSGRVVPVFGVIEVRTGVRSCRVVANLLTA